MYYKTILLSTLVTFTLSAMESPDLFPHALLSNDREMIERNLKDKKDPNGKSPIGTPYISFVASTETLNLLYDYGLKKETLNNCVQEFLTNNNIVTSDHTAARLIAYKDPHTKDLDKRTRKALKFAFTCIQTYKNHHSPLNDTRVDIACLYQDAGSYLNEIDALDTPCSKPSDTFFIESLRKNEAQKVVTLIKAGIDPNGATADGKPYIAHVRSSFMLHILYGNGLKRDTLPNAVTRFLSYTNDHDGHLAARLIGCEDPHTKDIDRETRLKLFFLFNSKKTHEQEALRKHEQEKAQAILHTKNVGLYRDAMIYLNDLDVKEH